MALPEHLGVEVCVGRCQDDLDGATRLTANTWCSPDRALVHVSGGWRALIEGGRRITVQGPAGDPALDPDSGVVGPTWLLDGWAVPFALLQQGLLPLHATTVDVAGRVVAIGGPSGVGKSTTALTLAARGHTLLTDDVAAIEIVSGRPMVRPFRRRIHLHPDTASALSVAGEIEPLAGQPVKGALVPADPPTRPRVLAAVVGLAQDAGVSDVEAQRLHGHQGFAWLLDRAGRSRTAPVTLGRERYFEVVTAIANASPIWRVRRPATAWTADAVAAAITDAIESLASTVDTTQMVVKPPR